VPVPVGQQSRDALANLLGNNELSVGPSQGTSYGRTVAPATVPYGLLGETDVGRQQVRRATPLPRPRSLTAIRLIAST
jgi:endonuclease YncB( thermonuclease family)